VNLLPPTLLLTGFEPFGGERINPSWQVAQALQGQTIAGAQVQALCLPCSFGLALHTLRQTLASTRPALVLSLGQAQGRCDFSIERVAINVDDARIPDNAGARPVDQPVVPGGPAAYFSTLPIKAMVAALRAAGLPASVSQTAGTYVCNHVFYGLMHALHGGPAGAGTQATRGGFIHLPLLPEQAAQHPGQPSLPLATLVDGVRLALQTAWLTHNDLVLSGGAEA
jgi:pyroglutamyl-peptidase